MSFDEMESYRHAVDEEAAMLKDSYLALERLHNLYRQFNGEERPMANQVLAEGRCRMTRNLRFDALALIDDFRIRSTIPALQTLASRLAPSPSPGAPYELKKVKRIIGNLSHA